MNSKLATLLLFLVSASGCASAITTALPANHFITSESNGGWLKGTAEVGLGNGAQLTIIPDATAVPVNVQSSSFDNKSFLMGDVWLGILDRLDVQIINQNLTFGVKYQILGETALNAKAHDFSLSVSALGGSTSDSDTYTGIFSTVTGANSTTNTSTYDLAVIAGYRIEDRVLIYGEPFYTHENYHGVLVQNQTSGNTTVNYSGLYQQYGMFFGGQVNIEEHLFFKGEFAIAGASGNGVTLNSQDSLFLGGMAGVRF